MNQNLFIKKSWNDIHNFDQWPVLFCFSINFLNFFWSIINMSFHIIGSYTSQKINHSNRIDCPKYLSKIQALFRHKSHITTGLYLVYILAIQANWQNWKQTPQTTWDTQKILKIFRLIFIQPFYVINLIWWSIF